MMSRHAGRNRPHERLSLRQLARPYTSLAFAGKDLSRTLGIRLKQEPVNVIRYVLRESPVQHIRLLGTPFPKTIKDLGRPIPTHFADELIDELRWTLAVLLH